MQTAQQPQRFFFPWQTVFIAALTLGIASSPALTAILTVSRENWPQFWPLLTGHLCHWTAGHLFWDLLVFIIVGPLVERRLGRAFLPCLAFAGPAIVATVFLFMPGIESYRGLSGIDTFLYTFAILELVRQAYPQIPDKWRGFSFLPLFLLFAKTVWELISGGALFAGPLGDGVAPLPLAHMAGALLGLLVWHSSRGARSRKGHEKRLPAAAPSVKDVGLCR